jgi:hypothetical protein
MNMTAFSPARFRHGAVRGAVLAVGLVGMAWAESPRSHLEPARGASAVTRSTGSLGLKLTRASAVLRRQLALARGAGLVVDDVVADSPAARAGFAQHDVLVKLEDQLLVLPEQLDALLEAAESDEPLECVVLRNGREVTIAIAGAAEATSRPVAGTNGLRPAASALAIVQPAASGPVAAGRLRRLARETLLRQDADYQIRLTSGDEMRLVVTDRQGRVVFDDAIDTPEGRGRMPADVRTRVAAMEQQLEGAEARDVSPVAAQPQLQRKTPRAEIGRLDVTPVELR